MAGVQQHVILTIPIHRYRCAVGIGYAVIPLAFHLESVPVTSFPPVFTRVDWDSGTFPLVSACVFCAVGYLNIFVWYTIVKEKNYFVCNVDFTFR